MQRASGSTSPCDTQVELERRKEETKVQDSAIGRSDVFFNEDPVQKVDARGVLDEVHAIKSGPKDDRATTRVVLAKAAGGRRSGFRSHRCGNRHRYVDKEVVSAQAITMERCSPLVAPRILRVTSAIPPPRAELRSNTPDLVVDRLTLSSSTLVPDHINYYYTLLNASDATADGSFQLVGECPDCAESISGVPIKSRTTAGNFSPSPFHTIVQRRMVGSFWEPCPTSKHDSQKSTESRQCHHCDRI
jgi:hypothetical protein